MAKIETNRDPYILKNIKNNLVVSSSAEFMTDDEAKKRNEWIITYGSANIQWVKREEMGNSKSLIGI